MASTTPSVYPHAGMLPANFTTFHLKISPSSTFDPKFEGVVLMYKDSDYVCFLTSSWQSSVFASSFLSAVWTGWQSSTSRFSTRWHSKLSSAYISSNKRIVTSSDLKSSSTLPFVIFKNVSSKYTVLCTRIICCHQEKTILNHGTFQSRINIPSLEPLGSHLYTCIYIGLRSIENICKGP